MLSIAAGVSIDTLQQACGDGVAVVRSMPNTPALLGKGAAAMCGGPFATDDDLDWAEGILGAVGTVVRVPEPLLDAVTGLVGSGPAYLFLVAEALTDAGVLAGLTRPVADALVRQLFVGSAAMLAEYGDPVALRAMVTSPGGTTAAGLRVLEEHGTRSALARSSLRRDGTQQGARQAALIDRYRRFGTEHSSRRALIAPHEFEISWCDSFLSAHVCVYPFTQVKTTAA